MRRLAWYLENYFDYPNKMDSLNDFIFDISYYQNELAFFII